MVIDDGFAVSGEGTRRELLGALRSGDKSVGTLVEELEVSQPTVSKHLKVLREAGLVTMRAEGQKRYYSLQPAPLEEIVLWLKAFDLPSLQTGAASGQRLATVAAGSAGAGAPGTGAGSMGMRTNRPLFTARPTTSVPRSAADVVAAGLEPGSAEIAPAGADTASAPNLGRTVGRAAERAADLLGQFPKFRRRRS